MRPDLFRAKKGVHIMLPKTVHSEFRKMLMDRGLSMQRAFEEFAALAGQGNAGAVRIIEGVALRKVNEEIEKHRNVAKEKIDDLDHDTLYHLISNNDTKNESV